MAEKFELAAPIESIGAITAGHINETFLVVTAAADYVVQRINRSIFREPQLLVDNARTIAAHLGGRFVPELVATRAGGWIVEDGNDAWRAWNRVAGAETVADPTPAVAGSAATLLGRLHAGLADLDPAAVHETLPDFHHPARRLAQLRDIVAADPHDRAEGVAAEVDAALAAAPLVEIAADLVARVPRRVAHNDAKLDNVMFRDGEAVCIVDLDTVMASAWLWDVGDLVRTASTHTAEDDPDPERAVVDPALYRAILDGYRAGLSESVAPEFGEIEALEWAGAIVTYEQALRFLTDWIAGDVYFRTARPAHNLDRARAQLSLLASMPSTVDG